MVIETARDLAGLAKWLPVYFDFASQGADSLAARRAEQRRAMSINPARLEQGRAGPAMPLGFEIWIAHLGWLDIIAAATPWSIGDLTPEEAEGLALFRRAREKFWSEHLSCPACQSVNLRNASFCGGCGKEFR